MRILYLHQYFVSPDAYAGTRSYAFARRWIANGHDVCMVTSSAALPEKYRNLTKVTAVEISGIPCIVIPIPYSNLMTNSQRIRAFLRFAISAARVAVSQRADVVFATSTPLTIAIPAIAARLWQRIPMVFEVRDLWPAKPIAMGALRNPVLRWTAQLLEWIAYRASSHVVVLSPDAVQGVTRHGVKQANISNIPNGCDLELFDVPAARGNWVREKLNLAPDQPLVVYTGAFGYVNGLGYAIEIASHLRESDIHFLLVGTGIEREQLLRQAAGKGVLDHNLTIWDPLPKIQIPDVLAAATLATSFVIPVPELWDNSANKFFDGFAAGKPVAINHLGWQADLLTESGAGLVLPPDDAAQAAQVLAGFLHDQDRVAAAQAAARGLAQERFNMDHLAAQLEAILRHYGETK